MKIALLSIPLSYCWVLFIILLFSCGDNEYKTAAGKSLPVQLKNASSNLNIQPEAITKDFNSWYTYTYYNIHLSQDFTGLDEDSVIVQKDTFLNLLKTGKYLPVRVAERQQVPCYKLYPLHSSIADIAITIRQMADDEQVKYHMLGKELPSFDYTDLNGKSYTKANTKGKIVVVKCWFIHCVACVKEFPELNKLVEQYKNNPDMLFVSLAMDSEKDLSGFLEKNTFEYAVVPVSQEYMMNELNVQSFPTHIVIGKNGKIAAVVGDYNNLKYALKKELEKG